MKVQTKQQREEHKTTTMCKCDRHMCITTI